MKALMCFWSHLNFCSVLSLNSMSAFNWVLSWYLKEYFRLWGLQPRSKIEGFGEEVPFFEFSLCDVVSHICLNMKLGVSPSNYPQEREIISYLNSYQVSCIPEGSLSYLNLNNQYCVNRYLWLRYFSRSELPMLIWVYTPSLLLLPDSGSLIHAHTFLKISCVWLSAALY